MDPEDNGEEVAPLVVVVDDSSSEIRRPKNHARDAHILSFAFLFIFSAYGAAQNLQSTVNTEQGLGTTSMGILYLSFTFFSVFASVVVRWLGSKKALVLGTTGYLLFIASNLKPLWYTMVPASFYLGFTASIIWVGQGTYLTSAARRHAKDCKLHEGTVIGNFNGEFWGFFASTQVIGNLISLLLLQDGNEGGSPTGTGLLFTIFLGCMIFGAILMCFLSKRDEKEDALLSHTSIRHLLKSVVVPLLETRILLIIPLMVYSGLQQAFVWAEFTKKIVKPAIGMSGVGGAMAVYGAADAISSLLAGRYTSGLSSVTIIVSVGSFLQISVLLWLLFGYSLSPGVLGSVLPLLIGAIWGVGDGVFNTQLNALFGMLFKHDTEAIFAQFKVWQSAAIAVVFFLSPAIGLEAMVIVMIVALFIAISAFLFLTLHIEKSSTELHE
ncbi:UNC93-like protein 3 [Dendrobium catenatum]|uniref:UNC93-like protein 3 n=1 Tax=Dendrobium catenatum TaxID=906689 RepID=UPI0009F32258|nr:UNC93-like protein 3 [Dendrobium catenatum]